MADPLPLRWTVVLWEGEPVTVVLAPTQWAITACSWQASRSGEQSATYGHNPEDALRNALRRSAPYRAAYPEGEDPVALAVAAEREACARVADEYPSGWLAADAIRSGERPKQEACVREPYSSRMCEHGTKCCEVRHARGAQGGERGR